MYFYVDSRFIWPLKDGYVLYQFSCVLICKFQFNFPPKYTHFFPWLSFAVPFRHGERIGFSYLVSQKYTGDKALVKVLRKSEILEYKIKLATHKRLIQAHINGKPPSYYIIAGFVFAAVTVPYLRSEVLIVELYGDLCIHSF